MSNIIVYSVNESNAEAFIKTYPKIKEFILSQRWKGKNFLKQYCSFINVMNKIPVQDFVETYGGRYETISSESFGTKDFLKLDWHGLGGWAELYQYILKK